MPLIDEILADFKKQVKWIIDKMDFGSDEWPIILLMALDTLMADWYIIDQDLKLITFKILMKRELLKLTNNESKQDKSIIT